MSIDIAIVPVAGLGTRLLPATKSQPKEMFVNIDKDGQYYVTGRVLGVDELHPVLKAAWVNNPGRASVIIRADQRCPWKFVVAVMNACNKANIRDYRVTTLDTGG